MLFGAPTMPIAESVLPFNSEARQEALRLLQAARHIVLVHSGTDSAIVTGLRRRILRLRRDQPRESLFMASDSLRVAQDVTPEMIRQEIARADLVVVVCGADTGYSELIDNEVVQALDQRRKGRTQVLPILLAAGVRVPQEMDFHIPAIHRISLFPSIRWVPIGVGLAVTLLVMLTAALWRWRSVSATDADAYVSWTNAIAARDERHDRVAAAHLFARAADLDGSVPTWENAALAAELALGDARLAAILDPGGPVKDVVLARDKRLVVVSSPRSVRLWDADNLLPIGEPIAPSTDNEVNRATLDDTGERLAIVGSEGRVVIWDLARAREVGTVTHGSIVDNAMFSPDSQFVVAFGGDSKEVSVWDAVTLAVRGRLPHGGRVSGVQFDGQGRLLTWSDDKDLRLWDLNTMTPVGSPMPHEASIRRLTLDRQRQRVLTTSGTAVHLWSLLDQRLVHTFKHSENVAEARFDPTEQSIVTLTDTGTAVVWDVTGEAEIGRIDGHKSARGVTFDAHGRKLLTWSSDGLVATWNAQTLMQITSFQNATEIACAQFLADGRFFTCNNDRAIRLWSSENGAPLGTLQHQGTESGNGVFDEKGQQIFTWTDDGGVRVWRVQSSEPVNQAGLIGAFLDTRTQHVLTQSEDGTVNVWDALSRRLISSKSFGYGFLQGVIFDGSTRRILTWGRAFGLWDSDSFKAIESNASLSDVRGLAVDRERRRFVTWDPANVIHVWGMSSGEALKEAQVDGSAIVGGRFARDGRTVALWSKDTVKIVEVTSARTLTTLAEAGVKDVQLSADAGRAVTLGSDGVRVWDVSQRQHQALSLNDTNPVRGIALDPDGTRLIVYTSVKTRLWNLAGDPPAEVAATDTGAFMASFDPSAQRIVTVDGRLRLWEPSTLKLIGSLLPATSVSNFAIDGVGAALAASNHESAWVVPTAPSAKWQKGSWRFNVEKATGTRLLANGQVEAISATEWQTLSNGPR